MADETLQYTGTFDGTQIVSSLKLVDTEFAKMGTAGATAFTGISKATVPAVQGIKSVQKAEHDLSAETELMTANHEIGFRTINRAAHEGFASMRSGLDSIRAGALDSAGAMDILQVSLGAAFHGPLTLAIVAATAAMGFLVNKIKDAHEAARDVKWFGDEAEVTERFEKLTEQYDELHKKQKLLLDPNSAGGFASSMLALNNGIVTAETREKKEQLAIATKLHDNLVQQMELETKIANIEAEKIRMHGEAQLKIAEAANDPVAKMRAQQEEVVNEKKREQDQLLLLIKEHGLQEEVVRMQLAVKASTKEEIAEEGKNKVKLKKLDMQLTAENAMYTAKGDELLSIEKAQAIDLLNEKDKTLKKKKEWFDGMQSDTEASPSYLAQQTATLESEAKFQAEISAIDAEAREVRAAAGQDAFTQKMAQVDLEYTKRKAVYDKEALDEAKRSGDSVIATQRKNEKIEMLDALKASKLKAIEADRVKATAQMNSQLTSSLVQDSATFVETVMGQNKLMFAVSKALAAAEVVVNTQMAAAKIEAQLGVAAAFGPEELLYAGMAVKLATIAATAIQGFAGGTDNAPAGMAWVGERGPELVNFRGGEKVYTAEQSRGMSGGLSIGAIHLNFSGGSPDAGAVSRAVTSGILEANDQLERTRSMRFFNNGTLAV